MMATNYTPTTFAVALLQGLKAPVTAQNLRAIVGWEKAEGGNWNNDARYNPLNTTQTAPGAGNTGTQGNIKVYTSWNQGLQATLKTLNNGLYGGILSALKKGSNANAVGSAITASPWGTGGLAAQVISNTKPITPPTGSNVASVPTAPTKPVKAPSSSPASTAAPATPLSDPRQLAAVALLLGQQGPYGQNTQALSMIQQNLTAQQAPASAPKTPKVRNTSVTPQTPQAPMMQTPSAGYVNPLGKAQGLVHERTDQGVDFAMKPGSKILAVGDGKVTAILPNWFKGQPLVAYQLTSGKFKGRTVFLAEQINPLVKVGDSVRAGQTIATYANSGTGIEMGWGRPSGQTEAMATTGYTEGQVTPAGARFNSFLKSLGVK